MRRWGTNLQKILGQRRTGLAGTPLFQPCVDPLEIHERCPPEQTLKVCSGGQLRVNVRINVSTPTVTTSEEFMTDGELTRLEGRCYTR